METCDISLVKEETVELIKTETQNEDEFDICGQSGIKTERQVSRLWILGERTQNGRRKQNVELNWNKINLLYQGKC
uniref:Uncharacterized protein n=1 Tax=Timema genevievae TaxID=629358 RepID=A0A7R9JYI1_TIMGE|nr:unnamed protein product [Timema genevievae]